MKVIKRVKRNKTLSEVKAVEGLSHMETIQLICNANRLMGLCEVQVF